MAEQVSPLELARELGVTTEEVLDALADFGDAPPTPDAVLPREAVELARQRLRGPEHQADALGEPPAGGADLIVEAFELARAGGKSDWRRMSAAVLKNRILDLTERSFDERSWGVESFTDWLTLFADLVRVDHRKHPPVVELLGGDETPVATQQTDTAASLPAHPWKVRRDLWLALTSPGTEGRWDWLDGVAVLIERDASPEFPLPHISASEMQDLRHEFVTRLPEQLRTDTASPVLDRWARDLLPSATIPARHRALWNATLKRAVVDRLRAWFKDQGVEAPADLIEEVETPHALRRDATEELRSLVIRCVEVMTHRELEQLPLPASVVLRLRRR